MFFFFFFGGGGGGVVAEGQQKRNNLSLINKPLSKPSCVGKQIFAMALAQHDLGLRSSQYEVRRDPQAPNSFSRFDKLVLPIRQTFEPPKKRAFSNSGRGKKIDIG